MTPGNPVWLTVRVLFGFASAWFWMFAPLLLFPAAGAAFVLWRRPDAWFAATLAAAAGFGVALANAVTQYIRGWIPPLAGYGPAVIALAWLALQTAALALFTGL